MPAVMETWTRYANSGHSLLPLDELVTACVVPLTCQFEHYSDTQKTTAEMYRKVPKNYRKLNYHKLTLSQTNPKPNPNLNPNPNHNSKP